MDSAVAASLQQKRALLVAAILQNILDFLFLRRANSMLFESRLVPLHSLVTSQMQFDRANVKQQRCVDDVQQLLTSVARKSAEATFKTKQLLKEQQEEPT